MGHLTLLFDVSSRSWWLNWLGWWSRILGGWKNWGWLRWMEWMEWMGRLESVTPVNGEQGVNRLGTSRLEVDEVGVVDFQIVVRLTHRGFLLGNRVVTPDEDKVTRTNDSGGSGGYGQSVQGTNRWIRWDIGVDGGDGGDSNGVGCQLEGGWGVGMVSKTKCSMSNL